MAFRILRVCGQISQSLKSAQCSEIRSTNSMVKSKNLLSAHLPIICPQRTAVFYTKIPGDTLWRSATGVSNAGKRRGRGKGKKPMKNLNYGQQIGVGRINMLWPGLTSPIIQGKSLIQQQRLPDDPDFEKKLVAIRDTAGRYKKMKVHPFDRGWTSAKMAGRKIGPPDPVGDEKFEGFDTTVLEHKIVGHMTGNMGRKRTFSCFVITGNKNGLLGIALGKATDSATAIRNAKNSSGKKLFYINRYNEHTVFHDFFTQFGTCKIYVSQKQPGFGLVCHRAIREVCEIIGIKDLHAKIEGTTNVQTVVKAFLIGLLRQKTHDQLAEEKKLHLVEFRKENGYFPHVVATPSTLREDSEIPSTELMDFSQYVMGGKVVLRKQKALPFYMRERGWSLHLKKSEKLRNKEDVRLQLKVEYGEVRSFLTEKYPEAIPKYWRKKKVEEEVVEE